ncbi:MULTISPECIES: cytochrome bd oxidase small subunit CydS [Paenibacillus]
MDNFLIFYAPPLVAAAALIFLFLWNGRRRDPEWEDQ